MESLSYWLSGEGCRGQGRGASKKVELSFQKDGELQSIKVDKVLVTVGRKPNTKDWGLETMGVRMDTPDDS